MAHYKCSVCIYYYYYYYIMVSVIDIKSLPKESVKNTEIDDWAPENVNL